jgi:DNA-binding SARP family transcriptional activator
MEKGAPMLMKDEGQSSSILLEALPSPHIVAGLLKTKQYHELDDLLDQAQSFIRQNDHHPLIDDILLAARQICIACCILHDDVNWYRWAAGEAERREEELKSTLQTISDVIGGNELVRIRQQPGVITAPGGLKTVSSKHHPPDGGSSFNIWQLFQSLLKPELRFPSYSAEASILTPTPAETNRNRVSTPPSAETPPESETRRQDAGIKSSPDKPASIQDTPLSAPKPSEKKSEPSIVIYGLGTFQVYINGKLVEDWPNRKGKSILKYLLLHREAPVPKDRLMDTFWPDAKPDAARRNLHQAIYTIRRTLRAGHPTLQSIRFENDCYLFDPDTPIWVDYEEFSRRAKAGLELEKNRLLAEALVEYSIADGLYQNDFLEEDLYEEWSSIKRQQLRDTFLELAGRLSEHYLHQTEYTAAMALCHKIIKIDRCQESAYRRLMKCYLAQGQRHFAIRQYLTCLEVLKEDLDLLPSQETVTLYQRLVEA